jgi:hypothetical protein
MEDSLEHGTASIAEEISAATHDVVVLKSGNRQHVKTAPGAELTPTRQRAGVDSGAREWKDELTHQGTCPIVYDRDLSVVVEGHHGIGVPSSEGVLMATFFARHVQRPGRKKISITRYGTTHPG